MKNVLNRKVSKHPQPQIETADLNKKHLELSEIGVRIDDFSTLQHFLSESDEHKRLVRMNLDRFVHLSSVALKEPLTGETKNLVWHGEMRGRLSECLNVAGQLQGIAEYKEKELVPKRNKLKEVINNMASKLKGKDNE